jgi:hypothetical protein
MQYFDPSKDNSTAGFVNSPVEDEIKENEAVASSDQV